MASAESSPSLLNSQLWEACLDGDVSLVKKLIAQGADMQWKGQGDKTPLAIAAYCDKSDVVEVLLKHGANVNEVDESNRSALHWAAQFGLVKTAKVLLSYGANASIPTKISGSPPLLVAAHTGQLSVLKLLVSKGASWNIRNNDGISPMDIAKAEKHDDVVKYLSQLDNSQARLLEAFSSDIKIQLKVTRMSIHGPPGSGKTCLQKLLLNENPPEVRESTGVLTPAVRACTKALIQSDPQSCDSHIKRVSEEEFLSRLAQKLNTVLTEQESTPSPSREQLPCRASKLHKLFKRKRNSGISSTPILSSPAPSPFTSSCSYSVNYEIVSRLPTEFNSTDDCNEQYKAHWIYCIDSGGQPAFQDIAPPFLRLNCINIITLRLIDKLDDYSNSEFVLYGRHFSCLNGRQLTNRQTISSFARSLLSIKPTNVTHAKTPTDPSHADQPATIPLQPNLLVIGTFEDRMEECNETLQEKNMSLKEDLQPFKDMCIQTVEGDFIHPVNTLIDTGRTDVATYLSQIITRRSNFEEDVPFKWFCFHLEVVKQAKGRPFSVIGRDECLSIASGFDMEPTIEDALLFFDNLGTILYFPSILPNIIFTDPDPLLKNISQLIYLTFVDNLADLSLLHFALPPSSHQKLKENGIFTMEVVIQLCKDFIEDLFTARDFINLLLKLLVISKVSLYDYFIPCVLPWLPFTSEERHCYCRNIDPITLSWIETTPKPIPYGLFTGLVNIIADNESFSLLESSERFHQRRNVIGFDYISRGGWLILVDQISYIEVFFTGLTTNCVDILHIVYEGLMKSSQTCRYDVKMFRKGFYDESCGHIHYASNDNSYVTVVCHHDVYHLTCKRRTPWFGNRSVSTSTDDNVNISELFQPSKVDDTPFYWYEGEDFEQVLDAVIPVVKWEDLGLALHLNPPIIDQIKVDQRGEVAECRKSLIKTWMMNSEHSSWRTLCIALYKHHPTLAQRIGREHPHKKNFKQLAPLQTASLPIPLQSALPQKPHVNYSKPEQVSSENETVISKTSDVYQCPHKEENNEHGGTHMV